MKKMMVILMMVLVASMSAQVADVKLYSGESALSSGFGATATLTSKNYPTTCLIVEFNPTLGQAILLKNFDSGLSIGPSGGIWGKTVWVAPYIGYTYKIFTLTSWIGVAAGELEKPAWKAKIGFAYHSIDLKWKQIGAGYSILHVYEDVPLQMPTVNYSLPYGDGQFIMSATYEMTHDRPMFMVAWKHILQP